jgi:ribosomal-protein-alanine N-acetyltransferase
METPGLRPFRQGDEEDLVSQANNHKLGLTLRDSFPFPYTLRDARRWIEICEYEDPDETISRAIVLNDRVVGGIGVVRQSDIYYRNAEIGYWLGEAWWGKGVMSIAVQLMTQWIAENTDIYRMYAGVFSTNHASIRVLEKSGYFLEAIHKKAIVKNGIQLDEHLYVKFCD